MRTGCQNQRGNHETFSEAHKHQPQLKPDAASCKPDLMKVKQLPSPMESAA